MGASLSLGEGFWSITAYGLGPSAYLQHWENWHAHFAQPTKKNNSDDFI